MRILSVWQVAEGVRDGVFRKYFVRARILRRAICFDTNITGTARIKIRHVSVSVEILVICRSKTK